MANSKFQLILTEPSGDFATPDITITSDFQTVFSIQNASDITKRQDTITQAITFPGTKNNNRIFNNLFSLNRSADTSIEETLFFNYSPVVGVRAVLYENNYPIAVGLLTIQDIAKDKTNGEFTYTGTITGNLVNFFGKLRDVLLTDLNLFDQDVLYDFNNITSSWDYADDTVFLFPSIDYGKGISPDPTRFDVRNFRPAIYARWYLKKILGNFGYKYKSTFIDSPIFSRAYLPYAESDFGTVVTGDVIAFNGGARGSLTMNRNDASTALTGAFINDFVVNPYVTTQVADIHGINGGWGRSNVLNDRQVQIFTFEKASNTGAKIDFSFSIISHAKSTVVEVQVARVFSYHDPGNPPFKPPHDYPFAYDASAPLADFGRTYGEEIRFIGTTVSGSLSLPVAEYDKGYMFALVITTVTDKGDDLELTQISNKITFGNPDVQVGSIFTYNLGDTFNLNEAVPKSMKATDLLKTLFTTFNMYAIQDPDDDQQLIIEPYDLFYSKCINPANYAEDWTKKVDNASLHIKINTALPKTYDFKFDSDKDFYNTLYNKTYGVDYGDFSIDNSIGTAAALEVSGIFAATPIVTENKDDKTMPAIFDGTLSEKKPFKSKPRILYNNGSASCNKYTVVTTKGDVGALTYENLINNVVTYNISHHVLTIDGVSIFNLLFGLPKAVYYTVTADVFNTPLLYSLYQKQLQELDDVNIFTLELDIHLRDFDISALDLSRPIFINTVQGIAYFKIMSVTYFNSDEVSNVVFQKIILGKA